MKKILLIVAFFLLSPVSVFAAITHDADSTKVVNGFFASPTNTWSHTTAVGSTLGVLTCALWQDGAGSGTVASASLNSVAITEVNSTRSGGMYSYIGYLVNPSSGTQTVSVTVTGNIDAFKCSFSTYAGTETSSVVDTSALATTGATPYTSTSVSITTASAGELVVSTLSKFGTQALTAAGGQTAILTDSTGATGGGAGYQVVASASSVSPSFTMASNSNDWSMVAVAFKEATAVSSSDIQNIVIFD